MTNRNTTIDFLRGFAIIIMILIHVTAYYWEDKFPQLLWDYTHFAVPIFIFCSAFVYFERKKDSPISPSYFYKRAKRLIIPYYIYQIISICLVFLFAQTLPSTQKLMKYFLLVGANDRYLSWLVVLFLYLIIILPFVRLLAKKRVWLHTFSALSLLSSIYLLFHTPRIGFRYIMWLPWAVIVMSTYYYIHSRHKKQLLLSLLAVSALCFIISRQFIVGEGKSTVLIQNKYPPNIYYLSYGVLWISGLYGLYNRLHITNSVFLRFFHFVSTHSYSLFFIHYVYLYIIKDVIKIQISWWLFFIMLTILSLVTQIVINRLKAGYFFSILKNEKLD